LVERLICSWGMQWTGVDWIMRTSSGRLACPGSPDERLLNRTSGSAARPVLISRASRSSLALYRKVTTWACIREWGKCRVSAPTTIGPRATPHLICRCVTVRSLYVRISMCIFFSVLAASLLIWSIARRRLFFFLPRPKDELPLSPSSPPPSHPLLLSRPLLGL